jgi:HTH-type transcriptional regulator / antitoxin HigA
MLMVNDRRLYSDTFWFTLLHEIGHIINKDYGISFEKETGEQEKASPGAELQRVTRSPVW